MRCQWRVIDWKWLFTTIPLWRRNSDRRLCNRMLRYANDNEANPTQKEVSQAVVRILLSFLLQKKCCIGIFGSRLTPKLRAESVCERDWKRTRLRLHLYLRSILAAYWWWSQLAISSHETGSEFSGVFRKTIQLSQVVYKQEKNEYLPKQAAR